MDPRFRTVTTKGGVPKHSDGGMCSAPARRDDPSATPENATDPIPVGATNLTIGASLVAALAVVFEMFTDWSTLLTGEDAGAGNRAALAIALIAALTVVFAADLLARLRVGALAA